MSALILSLNIWRQIISYPLQINLFLSNTVTRAPSELGCGIVYHFWKSTGRTDILYLLSEKYLSIQIDASLLCITVIILLLLLSYMNYSSHN
ncbi:hypothetical protein BZK37_09120 [Enterococcus casseliflavus]|nr:hypothetical protein BZK37_09120 [Enterococcus casseliflavus]